MMNKSIKVITATLAILSGTYAFAAMGIADTQSYGLPLSDSVLLRTHWKQMGGFEKFTPDHLRLGCWSTALAQIMFYHQLTPTGRVTYQSTKGFIINEKLDSIPLAVDQLVTAIDSTTSLADIDAVARYNYYAAVAIRKDFGTDNYMHALAPAKMLATNYAVKVKRYISWRRFLPYSNGKLKRVIKREINAKRPLFLHFANMKDFGHSVVIDGYEYRNDRFFVHINQGQGGPQDGWYDFGSDILKDDDLNLRVIYTFKPFTKPD